MVLMVHFLQRSIWFQILYLKKTKEEITASRGAETSTKSFHSQNDDHEEYVNQLTGKQQPFACHPSQSPERPCAMPGEVVETTTARHLGNTIDNDMQEDCASNFHSDNSLASSIECQKINVNRFTMPSSNMMYNKDKFQEINEEKSHSGSSVDEGCAIKK